MQEQLQRAFERAGTLIRQLGIDRERPEDEFGVYRRSDLADYARLSVVLLVLAVALTAAEYLRLPLAVLGCVGAYRYQMKHHPERERWAVALVCALAAVTLLAAPVVWLVFAALAGGFYYHAARRPQPLTAGLLCRGELVREGPEEAMFMLLAANRDELTAKLPEALTRLVPTAAGPIRVSLPVPVEEPPPSFELVTAQVMIGDVEFGGLLLSIWRLQDPGEGHEATPDGPTS